MDRNSNVYTFIYASGMVIFVAAILSLAAINLKPFQDKNIEIEKKQNILSSVNIQADASNAEEIYAEKIINSYIVNSKGEKLEGDAFTVDLKKERAKAIEEQQLPVFECQIDGGVKYIVPLRGAGLLGTGRPGHGPRTCTAQPALPPGGRVPKPPCPPGPAWGGRGRPRR